AEDLKCFLKGEPIHARPVSRAERAWSWCNRKRALASFVAATSLLLMAVLIGLPMATIRIVRERAKTQANLVRQYVAAGNRLAEQGSFLDALPWLAEALHLERDPPRMEMDRLRLAMTLAQCPIPKQLWSHSAQVVTAEFNPDGDRVAVGASDGTVKIWNVHDGTPAAPALKHGQRIASIRFSPDGSRLLTVPSGPDEISPTIKLHPPSHPTAR